MTGATTTTGATMTSRVHYLRKRKAPLAGRRVDVAAAMDDLPFGAWLVADDGECAVYAGHASKNLLLLWHYDVDGKFQYQSGDDVGECALRGFRTTGELWEPTLPAPDLSANTGWMDRDGRLYPCNEWGHNGLAEALEYHHNLPGSVDAAGYLKLNTGTWVPLRESRFTGGLSQRQLDGLFDWHMQRGRKLKGWMQGDEGGDDE